MRYQDKDRGPATPAEFWTVVIFMLFVLGAFGAEIFTNYHPGKAVILFFFLFWIPLIALHEWGHAITAQLFGWQVNQIVIGVGKVVRNTQIGSIPTEIRIIPVEGFVTMHPLRKYSNFQHALIYFAGPGIELLVFFFLLILFGWNELTTLTDSFTMVVVQGLAAAALSGAILNLIPHGTITDRGLIPNDGLGILRCLFASSGSSSSSEDDDIPPWKPK